MGFFKGIGKIFKSAAKPILGGGLGYATGGPLGGILGALSGFGGSGQNPADAGMPYLNQIPGMAMGFLNPYTEEGREAYKKLLDQYSNISDTNINQFPATYNKMAKDPTTFLNDLMRGYEPSRGYNYKQREMLGATRNAAAAGGFAGTERDQANQAEVVRDLLGHDMAEHLTNVMGIQNQGLAGEERRLSGRAHALTGAVDRGSNAAHDLASILGTNLTQQAGLRFQGQREANLARAMRRNDRMNLFGSLLNPANQGSINSANAGLGNLFGSIGGMFGF